MELRQLESVYWVATLGSFSAAANHLNTTQPAISGRILGLERELGIAVFDRTGRHVQLTHKGREVFAHAERIIESVSAIRKSVTGEAGIHGTVRLGVTNTVAHTWLPQLIRIVHQRFPGLDIDFHVDTSSVLKARFSGRELDIIICVERLVASGITSEFLYSTSFNWVASQSTRFETDPVSVEEIARHRLVTYSKGTHLHDVVCEYFKAHGCWPVRLSGSNSVAAIVRLAFSGVGLCAIPGAAIAVHTSEVVKVLNTKVPLPRIDFFISYHNDPFSRAAPLIAEIASEICREIDP